MRPHKVTAGKGALNVGLNARLNSWQAMIAVHNCIIRIFEVARHFLRSILRRSRTI
jgi:hypothetical protein